MVRFVEVESVLFERWLRFKLEPASVNKIVYVISSVDSKIFKRLSWHLRNKGRPIDLAEGTTFVVQNDF